MRIAGVPIPDDKRIEVALTYIYGVGSNNVYGILDSIGIDPSTRVKDLSEEDTNKLQKALDELPIEGELRQRVRDDIQRLIAIGSYRGDRHESNLPVRGQRTKTNARMKRGRRQTVGAMKKRDRAKMTTKEKEK